MHAHLRVKKSRDLRCARVGGLPGGSIFFYFLGTVLVATTSTEWLPIYYRKCGTGWKTGTTWGLTTGTNAYISSNVIF